MDVINLFNIQYMGYRAGFVNLNDWDEYMKSLHLPEYFSDEFGYGNIPGDDTPGEFRDYDIPYQPLEYARDISLVTSPNQIAYYYDALSGRYFQWSGEEWSQVSDARISEVLDDKAYIDIRFKKGVRTVTRILLKSATQIQLKKLYEVEGLNLVTKA